MKEGQFATSPAKDAFKKVILDLLRERGAATRAELTAAVRAAEPELCDDSVPCSPGCTKHTAKWRHQMDRSLYDLTSSIPPAIRRESPGFFRLNR